MKERSNWRKWGFRQAAAALLTLALLLSVCGPALTAAATEDGTTSATTSDENVAGGGTASEPVTDPTETTGAAKTSTPTETSVSVAATTVATEAAVTTVTVTFKVNNATEDIKVEVESGAALGEKLPDGTTYAAEGYTFVGWYVDGDSTKEAATADTVISSDATYQAVFAQASNEISDDTGEGEEDVTPCTKTEGCTLEAGHEGDCIVEEAETDAADESTETVLTADEVQALIDALPSVEELEKMDTEELNAAYDAIQAANDAYYALSEEDQATVDDSALDELFDYFNTLIATPAEGGVAQIGETTYTTLDEAVTAAADGDTITVLADCETAGLNLSKNLTIKGAEGVTPTITFNTYGIALWGKALTFEDCTVQMNNITSTPYTGAWNWMAICASTNASLTLNNVTMNIIAESTSTNNAHCIYFCSNNKLNLYGSTLTIKNYKQDALEWDGGDGGYNINIVDSTFISDHNRSGFTGTFYATITNSNVQVINSLGNGSNGSHFIITDSTVDFSNNVSHGLSTGILTVKDSTITANDNGLTGIIFNNTATFESADVTITGTKGTSYWNAGMRALSSNASCTIDADCTFRITDNYVTGIFLDSSTSLTIAEGADVLVTRNYAEQVNCSTQKDLAQKGGGIVVRSGATANLSSTTQIYNNHAAIAGDDIYLESATSSITFSAVGSDWYLDGAPDCTDQIDGWYDDAAGNRRWEAHDEDAYHYVLSEPGTYTGEIALKAAHGLTASDDPDPEIPEATLPVPEIAKTATQLNDEDVTTVSLTVGADSMKEKVAVLFVLDYSTSADVRKAAADMLTVLAGKSNTDVLAAVVNYNAGTESTGWQAITTETDTDSFLDTNISSGTNYHAGLLEAQKLLNDSAIQGYTTYFITISDGITYLWTDETSGTTMAVSYHNVGNGANDIQNANSVYDMKYGSGNSIPGDWFNQLMTGSDAVLAAYNNTKPYFAAYADGVQKTEGTYLDFEDTTQDVKGTYLIGNEIALYKTAKVFKQIAAQVDYTFVFKKDEDHWDEYPYGEQLMDYLIGISNGGEISDTTAAETFSGIANQILYAIQSGTVTDVIGNDFDLEDLTSMTLSVGGTVLSSKVSGNYVYFGTADANDVYPYTVQYIPGEAGVESFIWSINVPVEKDAKLVLSYDLHLVNKATEPGKYGTYDEDGSEGYSTVWTNESAVLDYKQTDGSTGELVYPKPTVEYTVYAADPETFDLTVTKVWKDNHNSGSTRPSSITIQLSLNGEDYGEPVVLSKSNSWSCTFEDLLLDDGNKWTVYETVIPSGYKVSYSTSTDGTTWTITNTLKTTYTSSDTLLQTGQLNWPIPVLMLLGLATMGAGVLLLTEKRKGKYQR